MRLNRLAFLALSLFSSIAALPSQAALVMTPAPTTVVFVHSYTEWRGGDMVFKTGTMVAGCEAGFWLRPTDPGFQRNVALLTSAHLSGRQVMVWARDDIIWNGSSFKFCWVDSIRVM